MFCIQTPTPFHLKGSDVILLRLQWPSGLTRKAVKYSQEKHCCIYLPAESRASSWAPGLFMPWKESSVPWHATQNSLLVGEETTSNQHAKWEVPRRRWRSWGQEHLLPRHAPGTEPGHTNKSLQVIQNQEGLCPWQRRSS